MATAGFNQLLQYMAQADFFSTLLPFLLTFIVFYAIFERTNIFPEDSKDQYAALVSLIMSFFVAYFLVQNPVYQSFFSQYLGRVAIGMIGILGFLVFVGLVWQPKKVVKTPLLGIVIVLAAVAAFSLSGGTTAFIPSVMIPGLGISLAQSFNFLLESGAIWLLVIAGVLYWAMSEPGEGSGGEDAKKALRWLTGLDNKEGKPGEG